jgi:hypothetical protein
MKYRRTIYILLNYKMNSYKLMMLVFGILFVIIQSLIVNYLVKLERMGCKCAMDWRKNFIVFFLVLSIVYTLSTFFIDRDSLPLLQSIMVITGIVNVILALQYINRLKKEKCECSESMYRDILYLVSIFNAILYSLLIVLLIYFFFSMATYSQSTKTPKYKKSISIKPMKR